MSGRAKLIPTPRKQKPIIEVVNGVMVVKFPKEEPENTGTQKTAK